MDRAQAIYGIDAGMGVRHKITRTGEIWLVLRRQQDGRCYPSTVVDGRFREHPNADASAEYVRGKNPGSIRDGVIICDRIIGIHVPPVAGEVSPEQVIDLRMGGRHRVERHRSCERL